jgi:hypothetical protein
VSRFIIGECHLFCFLVFDLTAEKGKVIYGICTVIWNILVFVFADLRLFLCLSVVYTGCTRRNLPCFGRMYHRLICIYNPEVYPIIFSGGGRGVFNKFS